MPEGELHLAERAPRRRPERREPAAPSRAAPASAAADDDLPLTVGAHVRHARWGEGLVVGVERDGIGYAS